MTVEFSLSDLTVLSTGGYNLEFVGLKNYYEAFFSHASFKQTLTTSIGNMVIDVPLIIFFSLFVAMMLNRKMKCRGLVRAIFFLPVLLGAEAVSNALSLAAQMMAGGLSGTSADMAAASASSGTMNMDYLIDLFAQLALPDVVLDYISGAVGRISDIIQASGVQIVLFLAGLQGISSSLYEAARVDGATEWEMFWKITLPMIPPVILMNLVYTIVAFFTDATNPVIDYIYKQSFTNQQFGYGAAMSWVYFAFALLLCGISMGVMGKFVFVSGGKE